MPDLQPWWKLWCAALDDPALESLSLEDWARWARLALLVKRHGDGGHATFTHPWRSLAAGLRARAGKHSLQETVCSILRRLPGVSVQVSSSEAPSIAVTFKNWAKYQQSPSTERTRRYRDRQRHEPSQDGAREASRERSQERHRDSSPTPPRDAQEEKRGDTSVGSTVTASPEQPCHRGRGVRGLEHPAHPDRVVIPNDGVPCYPSAEQRAQWIHREDGCPRTEYLDRFPADLQRQCGAHRGSVTTHHPPALAARGA